MSSVRILAPAKLNLGLAVLGKRPDGYHEIDTIMAMIDLCDEIRISDRAEPGINIVGMDDVPLESNLMYRAAMLWCVEAGLEPAHEIHIEKRIPSPGGLGGGSSNAAATLRALNGLHGNPIASDHLHDLATRLGADCPFFLGTATARATGIGTSLVHLPSPDGYVVVIVPRVEVETKTARLYASLTPADYGSPSSIDAVEQSLVDHTQLGAVALPNSFDRAVTEMMPDVREMRAELERHGISTILSGAGPGFYTLAESEADANTMQGTIQTLAGSDAFTVVASFLENPHDVELCS